VATTVQVAVFGLEGTFQIYLGQDAPLFLKFKFVSRYRRVFKSTIALPLLMLADVAVTL